MSSFFLALFLLGCCLWQPPRPQRIAWSEQRDITWKDFRGKAPAASRYEAQAYCEIDGSVEAKPDDVHYTVNCYFLPKESWTKTHNNDYILHHEQLHFDLAEVYARRLRKALSETAVTARNATTAFRKLFKKYNDQLAAEQDRYDRETDHSIDREAQARWDTLVPQWLEETKGYINPMVNSPK